MALECFLKAFDAIEMVTGDALGQPSIDPLEHAIGLLRARPGDAVLGAEGGAHAIE